MLILGLETSCHETSAAFVNDGESVLSNVVASQEDLHSVYGGVVPEIACRAHIESITGVIEEARRQAGVSLKDIDGIAVTNRPGLIGALLIGVSAAKAMALALSKPLIGVNHIEAHLYAANFDNAVRFPAVGLVASGGHTSLFELRGWTNMLLLGSTTDDAAGEAFDKVAKILGLGYPGGPAIQETARRGSPDAAPFPRTFLDEHPLDFSFSGIKTAVLYRCQGHSRGRDLEGITLTEQERSDVAAGFQEAMVDMIVANTLRALRQVGAQALVVGGGVSAHLLLRQRLEAASLEMDFELFLSPIGLCGDNGAMIAGLGYRLLADGVESDLYLDAYPRMRT